jgi:hypothetical protein
MHFACSLERLVGIAGLGASVSFSSEDKPEEPQAKKYWNRCKNKLENATSGPNCTGSRTSRRILLLAAAANKPDYRPNYSDDKNDLNDCSHSFSF